MAVSLLVHDNNIRLSKHHKVELKGCEKEALSFFLKIAEKRDKNKEVHMSNTKTPKWKGAKDLKNLCSQCLIWGQRGTSHSGYQ